MDEPAAGASLGTVHLTKRVMADGKPLAAGHLSGAPDGRRAEASGRPVAERRALRRVRAGRQGRRPRSRHRGGRRHDIGAIAKGKKPKANSSVVEMLKGGDYGASGSTRAATNYLINMPARPALNRHHVELLVMQLDVGLIVTSLPSDCCRSVSTRALLFLQRARDVGVHAQQQPVAVRDRGRPSSPRSGSRSRSSSST